MKPRTLSMLVTDTKVWAARKGNILPLQKHIFKVSCSEVGYLKCTVPVKHKFEKLLGKSFDSLSLRK